MHRSIDRYVSKKNQEIDLLLIFWSFDFFKILIRGLSQASYWIENRIENWRKLPNTVRIHDIYGRINETPRIVLQYEYDLHVISSTRGKTQYFTNYFTTCTGICIGIWAPFEESRNRPFCPISRVGKWAENLEFEVRKKYGNHETVSFSPRNACR